MYNTLRAIRLWYLHVDIAYKNKSTDIGLSMGCAVSSYFSVQFTIIPIGNDDNHKKLSFKNEETSSFLFKNHVIHFVSDFL